MKHETKKFTVLNVLYVGDRSRLPAEPRFASFKAVAMVQGEYEQVLYGHPQRYADLVVIELPPADPVRSRELMTRIVAADYQALCLVPVDQMGLALECMHARPFRKVQILADLPEVRARLEDIIDRALFATILDRLPRALARRHSEQASQDRAEIRRLQHVANCDPLTDAGNRRALRTRFARQCVVTESGPMRAGLIMIDVDHLKKINDEQGHLAGDHVLRDIASGLRRMVQRTDLVFRIGGDEFTVLLPGVGIAELARFAEQLQNHFAKRFETRDIVNPRSTISVGYAHASEVEDPDVESILRLADARLYERRAKARMKVTPRPTRRVIITQCSA